MRVAIMQPTYLPWLGYLDLADQVDHFVLLDDVDFSGRSWQQRNRVRSAQGLCWLTVPVSRRAARGVPIHAVEISRGDFWCRHWRTLELAYARAPHFGEWGPQLRALYAEGAPWKRLVALNTTLLHWLFTAYGIATPLTMASELKAGGRRGAHLAELCAALGADSYLSPPGSEEYLREDASTFADRGISVLLHGYEHPVYEQAFPTFLPQASSIDLLFNAGPQALEILRRGRRASRPLHVRGAQCEALES